MSGIMANKVDSRPWLIMVYIAADDLVNEQGNETLSEYARRLRRRFAQRTTALNQNIHLAIFIDGLYRATSKTTFAEVYYLGDKGLESQTNAFLTYISDSPSQTPLVESAHLLDSGDDFIMQGFVQWACATFDPDDQAYRMLSLVGHGGGWAPSFGEGAAQPNGKGNGQPSWRGLCMDVNTKSSLSTQGLGRLLRELQNSLPNQGKHARGAAIDVLFLDACLMGMIEIAYEVRQGVRYLVAAESQLWGFLCYEDYLNSDVLQADTTPEQLACTIVSQYSTQEFRRPFAIAAVDLDQIEPLRDKTHELAGALLTWLGTDPKNAYQGIFGAYRRAQKFDYNSDFFLEETEEGYVDLLHFADMLSDGQAPDTVKDAARAVIDQIGTEGVAIRYDGPNRKESPINRRSAKDAPAVIAARSVSVQPKVPPTPSMQWPNRWNLANAYGLSIYMPFGRRDCRPLAIAKAVLAMGAKELTEHLQLLQVNWCNAPDFSQITPEALAQAVDNPDAHREFLEQLGVNQLREYYAGGDLAFLWQQKDRPEPHWLDFLLEMDVLRERAANASEGRDRFLEPAHFRMPQLHTEWPNR